MTTKQFKTTVVKSGSKVMVPLPFNPNDVWGLKDRHHIRGTVNGLKVRGALGSEGKEYFLVLGAAWRRDCGIEEGTKVDVVLSPEGPQSDKLSADVMDALNSNKKAKAFFDSLATFYRNGYIKWIESAKKPETRTARIKEMLELLKAGKKQK